MIPAVPSVRFEERNVVFGTLEVSEDRSEACGRNRVELHELIHHAFADQSTRHFFLAKLLHPAFDAVYEAAEIIDAHRALLASFLDRDQQFVADELLATLIALDHLRQDFVDALTSGEAAAAFDALTPAADLGLVGTETRVDHLVGRVGAVRATHGSGSVVPVAGIEWK